MSDFICPSCQTEWSEELDADGFYDGWTTPECPDCATRGVDATDYGDFQCPACDKKWRGYGNGGLVFGMVPDCPGCGATAYFA